jgi:hypothetical protein
MINPNQIHRVKVKLTQFDIERTERIEVTHRGKKYTSFPQFVDVKNKYGRSLKLKRFKIGAEYWAYFRFSICNDEYYFFELKEI